MGDERTVFQDRDIYTYTHPDGRTLAADPIRVARELKLYTRGRINDLCAAHRALVEAQQSAAGEGGGPVSEEVLCAGLHATGQLAAACIAAFSLPYFNPETGEGTLEKEALDLLAHFLAWLDAKKDSGGSPSS